MFNTKNKGYGFGPMPGFSRKKKSTLAKGNWDRDPKPNRTDCNAMDWRKQDGGEVLQDIMDDERDLKRAIEMNQRRIREISDEREIAEIEKVNSRFSDRMATGRINMARIKNRGNRQ